MWFTLASAATNSSLVNRLTECHVSGDRVQARRYLSSLVLAQVAVIALAVPLLLAILHFLPTSAFAAAVTFAT